MGILPDPFDLNPPNFDIGFNPFNLNPPSLVTQVVAEIKKWQPRRRYRDEEGYRKDLLAYLRKKFPDHSIRQESGPSAADISIDGRKIGIELKAHLRKKTEADRLYGQVDDHLQYFDKIIVVLCGDTDREKFHYIKDKLDRISKDKEDNNPFQIKLPTIFNDDEPERVILISKR